MNTNCNIIQDLIPIVKDGIASEESRELVLQHLENCPVCKNLYDSLPAETVRSPGEQRDAKILLAVRRSLRIIQLILLCVGGLIGISIGLSSGGFYNFLLLPLLGILSGVGPDYFLPRIFLCGSIQPVWGGSGLRDSLCSAGPAWQSGG